MRPPLFAPSLTSLFLGATAMILLILSLAAALSLIHVGLKLPLYQTIQAVGIRKPAIAGEMATQLSNAELLTSADRARVAWFLEHCGTTIICGARATQDDEPRTANELAILNCGNDPERRLQWYRLANGVLEITGNGPVYYPQFGDWSIEYRRTIPLSLRGVSDLAQPTLRINYSNLPAGFTVWTEEPRGIEVSYDKSLPPWRVSMPVLVALPAAIFPGLAIGLMGLTAWRRGCAHHGGAVVVTLWSAGVTALWFIAIRDIQPAEAFVDILQTTRYGVTHLPWVAGSAAAGWAFATAYWLHLGSANA